MHWSDNAFAYKLLHRVYIIVYNSFAHSIRIVTVEQIAAMNRDFATQRNKLLGTINEFLYIYLNFKNLEFLVASN